MIRTRTAGALLLAATLAACGRDAAGPSSQLRPDEARALALGLAGAARGFDGSAMAAPDVAATVQATSPFSITVKQTFPCEDGGTLSTDVTTSGEYARLPLQLVVDLTGTITPAACAFNTEQGTTLVVTGNPSLAVTGHAAVGLVPGAGVHTFSAKGGLSWSSSDGRSGTCAIDFTATGDFGANTRTVKGTLCGNSLDFTGALR